jgi:hypothetical protein
MDLLPRAARSRERAAALIIVLACVVLLVGLAVAYFSRTTTDRTVAQSSYNQSKVDQVAASAMNLIIGGIRQEISGVSPTPAPPYYPSPNSNMVPLRFGTTGSLPNLVRCSLQGDGSGGANPIPSPGVPSLASGSSTSPNNSTTNPSANGRSVSLARWNTHYLLPKYNSATDDSYPPSPLPSPYNPNPSVANGFTPPDWVILTRGGPIPFSSWNSTLANPTATNTSYAVGRYAYAIYDEGGLLDANVAGYTSKNVAAQYGPKGVAAFADLTQIGMSQSGIDTLVGWRNNFSAQPKGNFPNFNFDTTAAINYVNGVLSNTNGFMTVTVPSPTPSKGMSNTDQLFPTRQSLLKLRTSIGSASFPTTALQYLTTFSRELNAPTWTPTLNATNMGAANNGPGNIYAYATNANPTTTPTPTPINPNLLTVQVVNSFARGDGTTANAGDPLINRRFPLTRISGLSPSGPVTTGSPTTVINGVLETAQANASTPPSPSPFPTPAPPPLPSGGTIQRDFGLLWNSANEWWDYVGPGATPEPSIETLWQVANESREPNFFELLKAVILNGSLGMGSGSGDTFVNSEPKYYNTAQGCSDYQIIQIGANIISQWNSGNVPIFINFYDTTGNYLAAGITNLPYLNKLVFKPAWTTNSGKGGTTYQFDAWLLPSLWNPHQNYTSATGNVRIAMTSGSMTASLTSGSGTLTSSSIPWNPSGNPNQYMTVNASGFGTSPSAPTTAPVNTGSGSSISKSSDGYYGFHFTFPGPAAAPSPGNSNTAYPDFGASGCTFQMQVDVTGLGNWKAYQTWRNCGPNHPLIFQPPASSYWTQSTLQDPEFVTLDPRTLRFGVWGNAGNQSMVNGDYTSGVTTTLDQSGMYEKVTAFPPQSPQFSPSPMPAPTPNLYLCANNSNATVLHYTDLDGVMRQGDALTAGATTAMNPTDSADRPIVLSGTLPSQTPSPYPNGGFQSVAELGQVFRDQPWKTLSFTTAVTGATANSADGGLLDVFTLHESSMGAGKTSLNTGQTSVLKAILSGAAMQLNGGTLITSTQLNNIITDLTSIQPMANKAELVTRLAAKSSVTGLGNKTARESVLRAFSDAGQTRTWNLLIDVIAQSGRYPPNANNLAGFMVEGEQRYWVHVAIDRFTGQVIDEQIEVVTE